MSESFKNKLRFGLLRLVCKLNFATGVRFLIVCGMDVNAKTEDEWRPMHFAAQYGCVTIAKVLLQNGATIHPLTKTDNSSLEIALSCNRKDMAEFLVNNGSDVNRRQKASGNTPIFLAIENENVELTRLLLEHGANLNVEVNDVSLRTPLHLAIAKESLEIVKLITDYGISVDAPNGKGDPPVHFAIIQNKSTDILAHLIDVWANSVFLLIRYY